MTFENNGTYKLIELFVLAFDGRLSEQEQEYLNKCLLESPSVRKQYREFLITYVGLNYLEGVINLKDTEANYYDRESMQKLAAYEKAAPTVEVPGKIEQPELIQPTCVPVIKERNIKRSNLFTFVFSAAAMLFFAVYIIFSPAPVPPGAIEVATLVEQLNVQWGNSATMMKSGQRLLTNEGVLGLEKGIVEISYDNGVDVTIEGPALFQIERTGIYLEYGRLYSYVSESGLGFKVETPTTQFIDMGTEFGVQADVKGSSELHVIKGKVQLFAGGKNKSKSSRMVSENTAVRFYAQRNVIESIPYNEFNFIRQVDSTTGQVWQGQKRINPNLKLALIEDFQSYPQNVNDYYGSATPGGGGIWDTEVDHTGNILTKKIDGSVTLRIENNSMGPDRSAGVYDLDDTILEKESGIGFFRFKNELTNQEHNLSFMGLHHYNGDNPFTLKNSHGYGITAGFGLADSNDQPSSNSLDIITTDAENPTVLGKLEQGKWYDVWIVADNATNTFDLYIRVSKGPGSGSPGLPAIEDLVKAEIPFGISTNEPLCGMLFLSDEAAVRTANLWIDDLYWNGSNDIK